MYFDPSQIDAIKTVNNDYNDIRCNIDSLANIIIK